MSNTTVYPFGQEASLPSGFPIADDCITDRSDVSLSARQGKVLDGGINNYLERDLSSYSASQQFINTSTNEWVTSSANYKGIIIAVFPGDKILVHANASRYSYVAFLKKNTVSNGNTPIYATGCSVVRLDANSKTFLEAPADAFFMYVGTLNSGNNCSPQSVFRVESRSVALQNQIEEINSQRINIEPLSKNTGWLIDSNNKWSNQSSNDYECVLVPITPGEKYIVSGNTTGGYMAVLTSNTKTNNTTAPFSTTYPTRIYVFPKRYFIFTAPEDAEYLYLTTKSTAGARDQSVAISLPIADQIAGIDNGSSDVRDKFETAPDYFSWKKAEQLLTLKWTPLKAVPKSTSGNFSAGSVVTGTPYSSVAEYDKRIGFDVSIHTFMTAVHNKYSLLYTENVRKTTSASAYGRTYWGPSNSGAFFGVVCSGYSGYALGMPPYVTSRFPSLAEEGILIKVYDQSANGVKQGDILWQDGHNMIVHEVWRKNGIVTHVLVTEEWQPLARVRGLYTAQQFNSFLASESITIYRYRDLFKNIDYEPSPFVAVGDETPQTFEYNDDICTFAGDKASFIEGELIYIHCLNLDYPQMELYKGDTLVDTITLASDSRASLTSDELAYAVNLSNDGLTYGKYKARLKNGDAYSDYTYFEIINASVTVSGDTATYSSANAKAVLWYWQSYHGTGGGIHAMTELPGKKSGTIDVSDRSTNPLLKVLFQGDYGRVAATFLEQ